MCAVRFRRDLGEVCLLWVVTQLRLVVSHPCLGANYRSLCSEKSVKCTGIRRSEFHKSADLKCRPRVELCVDRWGFTGVHSSTALSPTLHSSIVLSTTVHSCTLLSPTVHSSTFLSPAVHSSTALSPAVHSYTLLSPAVHSSTALSPAVHSSTALSPAVHS